MSQTSNGVAEAYARTGELTASERHDLLANDRRRTALTVLAGMGAHVQLRDLAREVADRESGVPPCEQTIERVAITLHHSHLPKLDDRGVVDYDYESHRIDC